MFERHEASILFTKVICEMVNLSDQLGGATKFDYTNEHAELYEAYLQQKNDDALESESCVASCRTYFSSQKTYTIPDHHQCECHRAEIEAESVLTAHADYVGHILQDSYAADQVWLQESSGS